MSLYMPGAVQRPQPGGVTLDTSLPPRFIWHITWDQLRADGTQPDFSAVADYLIRMEYCPHIMWNPFTGYMEQYYPANVGGRALAYNNQDGSAAVQVEVFFTPGCVVDGVRYATVADTPLVGFADLLAWGESLGVPLVWPAGAPQWQGNSRDAGTWNNNAGHYGHCHSPGDTHTDPGPMPALTGTITVQGTITKAGTFMPDLTEAEQRRILAAADMALDTPGRAPGPRLFNTEDGAFIVGKVDGHAQNLWGGLQAVPAGVLNQKFSLPDGTVTNLAGILTAIHAAPTGATVTGVSDPEAVVRALATQLNKP